MIVRIIADFHIHTKYSRATSADMDLDHIAIFADKKGINVVGTGDFTHPKWFSELESRLEEAEQGLYKIKGSDYKVRFILSSEISNIYTKNGKCRKIHSVILMPSLKSVKEFNRRLALIGNIASDGRPIIGMDVKDLLSLSLEIDKKSIFIPAHIWTPWFSLFGSMSGFDTIEECFEELTPFVKVCETGLSSDPLMNWRLSQLDNITLISNSDSHSGEKLGREANVFDIDLSYDEIYDTLMNKNSKKLLYTIEFYPEEGKYHYDGHRDCKINLDPVESNKLGNICPACNKKLTVGVLNRVEKLADRSIEEAKKFGTIPFKSLMPLKEIIADLYNLKSASKRIDVLYDSLINKFGTEFGILLDTSLEELIKAGFEDIGQCIENVRKGEVTKIPGYDGEYGVIKIKEIKQPINTKLWSL